MQLHCIGISMRLSKICHSNSIKSICAVSLCVDIVVIPHARKKLCLFRLVDYSLFQSVEFFFTWAIRRKIVPRSDTMGGGQQGCGINSFNIV